MIVFNSNKGDFRLRRLEKGDHLKLHEYLSSLSEETRNKFGPHAYDLPAIIAFYAKNDRIGFIGEKIDTSEIIAYSIIKTGFLEHDRPRLESYGLVLSESTDCTFAPSVSDDWQGEGVGSYLYKFILSEIKALNIKRIILWGGVQANNDRALRFYHKHEFQQIGTFEYHGMNHDMVCEIEGKRD